MSPSFRPPIIEACDLSFSHIYFWPTTAAHIPSTARSQRLSGDRDSPRILCMLVSSVVLDLPTVLNSHLPPKAQPDCACSQIAVRTRAQTSIAFRELACNLVYREIYTLLLIERSNTEEEKRRKRAHAIKGRNPERQTSHHENKRDKDRRKRMNDSRLDIPELY